LEATQTAESQNRAQCVPVVRSDAIGMIDG
jgi:hypothetical protein